MENRATQLAIAHETLEPEDIQALLMEQAWLGSWFKAQQIPSADSDLAPLQEDHDAMVDRDLQGEPASMRDGPTAADEEAGDLPW